MKIAVLSDIHDNIKNLNKALQLIKQEKCGAIIFCGDYCSPTTFKTLAEFDLPVYAIFGNVDGAKYEIMTAVLENNYQIEQKNDLLEIKFGGKQIAICHKPEFALGLAATRKYDVVFYGHTHKKEEIKMGRTFLINPGEIYGGMGKATFAIFDTQKETVKFIEIE